MPSSSRIALVLAALALAGVAALALTRPAAPVAQQQTATGVGRDEVGALVHDYIVKNPDVLYEAQKEWNRRQEAKVESKRKQALGGYLAKLDGDKRRAILGNPDGDVTLVEFFDYNCGYCRRAVSDLDRMVKADPKLRVVLLELPVIRQESLGAAQVSVAVNAVAPERFAAFHDRLLNGQSLATKARALAVAKEMGLDGDLIEKVAAGSETEGTILEAKALADDLGVEATPTFVVGDEVVPNTTTVVDDLQGRIAAVRACGKAVC